MFYNNYKKKSLISTYQIKFIKQKFYEQSSLLILTCFFSNGQFSQFAFMF